MIKDFAKCDTKEKGEAKYVDTQTRQVNHNGDKKKPTSLVTLNSYQETVGKWYFATDKDEILRVQDAGGESVGLCKWSNVQGRKRSGIDRKGDGCM